MEFDYVILGSGDRSAKIKISPEVFFACRTCKSSWVSPCRGLSDPVDANIG